MLPPMSHYLGTGEGTDKDGDAVVYYDRDNNFPKSFLL